MFLWEIKITFEANFLLTVAIYKLKNWLNLVLSNTRSVYSSIWVLSYTYTNAINSYTISGKTNKQKKPLALLLLHHCLHYLSYPNCTKPLNGNKVLIRQCYTCERTTEQEQTQRRHTMHILVPFWDYKPLCSRKNLDLISPDQAGRRDPCPPADHNTGDSSVRRASL